MKAAFADGDRIGTRRLAADGVAFAGEGKLARKATGLARHEERRRPGCELVDDCEVGVRDPIRLPIVEIQHPE